MMNMHKSKMDAVKQWFSDFTVPQNNQEHLLKHCLLGLSAKLPSCTLESLYF